MQLKLREQKPWATDPKYFKHVKISALALLKMAMHARSGGQIEVMGILQGKLEDNTFVVLDAFALPVEGTESTSSYKVCQCTHSRYFLFSDVSHAQMSSRADFFVCLPFHTARVTALDEGYEYMVSYQTTCEASGRVEPVIGTCKHAGIRRA